MLSLRSAGHQSNAFRLGEIFATEPDNLSLPLTSRFAAAYRYDNNGYNWYLIGYTPSKSSNSASLQIHVLSNS